MTFRIDIGPYRCGTGAVSIGSVRGRGGREGDGVGGGRGRGEGGGGGGDAQTLQREVGT